MLANPARSLVRSSLIAALFLGCALGLQAADLKSGNPKPGEPTDPKARKTYQDALDWLKSDGRSQAIGEFRKAARQDGHSTECLRRAYTLAVSIGEYKQAEEIAREWLPIAASDAERAAIHYRFEQRPADAAAPEKSPGVSF